MASGGARNRHGSQPEPGSARSERRGIKFRELPAVGYAGRVPEFPIPDPTDREAEVWAELWHTPQAAAWAEEPWRWRTVALYTRWSVRMESPLANAAIGTVVHRLADQIGLTPAGIRENRWTIAEPETCPAHRADPHAHSSPPTAGRVRRLRAAPAKVTGA